MRALSRESQDWYAREWLRLQARFAEAPGEVLGATDELLSRLISDRKAGHMRELAAYRVAHDIAQRRRAKPEERQTAMAHYRALISGLLT